MKVGGKGILPLFHGYSKKKKKKKFSPRIRGANCVEAGCDKRVHVEMDMADDSRSLLVVEVTPVTSWPCRSVCQCMFIQPAFGFG